MKKPTPNNKESFYDFHELFFSTTDQKGLIIDGNEVFVRVSGYEREDLIGAPHNTVRHPDMPRAVFKLFWDTIKQGKPIGAYVKNLSSDGSYYWVFAIAFPVKGGFLSIRFKPSSAVFAKIQQVYETVLEKEHNESIIALDFLVEQVKAAGFNTYDSLWIYAATEELKSREINSKKSNSSSENISGVLKDISIVTQLTGKVLDENFSMIDNFRTINKAFEDTMNKLNLEFNQLKYLSINMKITATKYGDKAATLGVISHEFSGLSDKIEHQLKSFGSFIDNLTSTILKCSHHLVALKTQMIMVDFFVKESIGKLASDSSAFDGMLRNQDHFTNLFAQFIKHLNEEVHQLKLKAREVGSNMKEIQKFIGGLEVIKQFGGIESARDDEVRQSFDFYLSEMDNFVTLLRNSITTLNRESEVLTDSSDKVYFSIEKVAGNIQSLFDLALSLEKPQSGPRLFAVT
jgi:aerotaxis receptor